MMLKPIVNQIRKKRITQGLSQHQLSLASGLSGTSIMRLESGQSATTHHLRASAIADALGCKVEEIFTPANITNKGA